MAEIFRKVVAHGSVCLGLEGGTRELPWLVEVFCIFIRLVVTWGICSLKLSCMLSLYVKFTSYEKESTDRPQLGDLLFVMVCVSNYDSAFCVSYV